MLCDVQLIWVKFSYVIKKKKKRSQLITRKCGFNIMCRCVVSFLPCIIGELEKDNEVCRWSWAYGLYYHALLVMGFFSAIVYSFLVGCLTFFGRTIQSWQEIGVGQLWGLHKFFVKARRKLFLRISWISAGRMFDFFCFLHSLYCELLIICGYYFLAFCCIKGMLLVDCIWTFSLYILLTICFIHSVFIDVHVFLPGVCEGHVLEKILL